MDGNFSIKNDADMDKTFINVEKLKTKEFQTISPKEVKAYKEGDIEKIEKLQNIQERKKYAHYLFWLICGWMTFVAFLLIGCGIEYWKFSDAILITLLTTTTANILGLFIFVAKYLFK